MSTPAATIEPLYTLDTHALLWYLIGDKKLSRTARLVFESANHGDTGLIVPSIVIAELYYVNQRHNHFQSFAATFRSLSESSFVYFVDFRADDVVDFDIDVAVPEMHDRIITGVARRLGTPLITRDPMIVASGLIQTIW